MSFGSTNEVLNREEMGEGLIHIHLHESVLELWLHKWIEKRLSRVRLTGGVIGTWDVVSWSWRKYWWISPAIKLWVRFWTEGQIRCANFTLCTILTLNMTSTADDADSVTNTSWGQNYLLFLCQLQSTYVETKFTKWKIFKLYSNKQIYKSSKFIFWVVLNWTGSRTWESSEMILLFGFSGHTALLRVKTTHWPPQFGAGDFEEGARAIEVDHLGHWEPACSPVVLA